jgi:hypothetical protein
MSQLVLLPSPLLGPAVWRPVAGVLERRGWSVTVLQLPEVRIPDDVLEGLAAGIPDRPGVVLVPHSNAGLYVAPLADRRPVAATVFVDAGIPADDDAGPLAPADLLEHLESLADADGVLPPWTEWWEDQDVAVLFPDEATRRVVTAEQPRLPLAYLRGSLPSPPRWRDLPAGYLAFGDTYASERGRATDAGWPVRTLPGEHLHMLVDPDGVAAALTDLLGQLGQFPR